ncbi:metalloprotease ATP23 [Syncephalis plumigaleata]|nr:metalloprotease ATP23 [Syncephalis plumigaleata]
MQLNTTSGTSAELPRRNESIRESRLSAAATDQSTRLFEHWYKRFTIMSGYEGSDSAKTDMAIAKEEEDCRRCEKWRDQLARNSPVVNFMSKELEKVGCPMRPEELKCMPCDGTRSGGFSPEYGILLCQNRFYNIAHMEETIVHEMVHAYDHCKFNVDWSNCLHHACSEVRAATLSGDCGWLREMSRGNFKFAKQLQACVKRRAILSVSQNPPCSAPGVAERAVHEVFDSCFNDTQPFDEIY